MFRTTHRASLLVGALAVLAGARSTLARPAAPQPREPYSIVAQSTAATAGTGRRPISQRIAASNLPLRAPTPPDCAESVCHDDSLAATITPPESAEVAALKAAEVTAPADAETVAAAEVAAAEVARDGVAVADLAPASAPAALDAAVDAVVEEMVAEAEPPATVVDADAVAPDQPTNAVTLPPERIVTQVAAPAPAAPTSTVRESLLRRIKGALGPRPQAAAPATRAPEATTVVAEPSPDAAPPPPAPRPIPIASAGSTAMVFGQPTPADEADAHAAPDTLAADDSVGDVPARLEFDVRESRSLVGEGEQIVMRIAVRNVGGETAERVTATLFFAEGIEPVQAIGQSAEVYPGEVRFEAVPRLSPGSSVDLLVTAVGTRPGSVTYRGELECRQIAGRIAREGAVTVRARRSAQP